jgi:predicted CopG family antitoxin
MMAKTITLRVADETYEKLMAAAKVEKRSLSNLIEVLALKKLDEEIFVDQIEMDEILANTELMNKLQRGSRQAKDRKGTFVK